MEAIEVTVESRIDLGSLATKRLRNQGFVPAIIYTEGQEAKALMVEATQFRRQIQGKGSTQLFKLQSKDKDLNGLLAFIKSAQHEPMQGRVIHIDFYSVTEGHKITIRVPVMLIGECVPVKQKEAILNQLVHEVEIECLPTEIPSGLNIDITTLTLGHSLHARDIQLPAGVMLKEDPDAPIVSALHKKEEEAAPVVAEAAATPEAAAAAGTDAAGAAAKAGEATPQGAGKGGKEQKGKE